MIKKYPFIGHNYPLKDGNESKSRVIVAAELVQLERLEHKGALPQQTAAEEGIGPTCSGRDQNGTTMLWIKWEGKDFFAYMHDLLFSVNSIKTVWWGLGV